MLPIETLKQITQQTNNPEFSVEIYTKFSTGCFYAMKMVTLKKIIVCNNFWWADRNAEWANVNV